LVVLIGIYSLPVFAGRPLRSPLVSEIIVRKSGLLLGGVLFVAVLAAVMSTMDTAINTGALSLTRDVFQQVFPSSGPGAIVLASRLSTLAVGGIAFLVATRFQSILKTIGLASEIMAEGLFIPGLAMIFLRRRLPLAGLLSLLGGGGFSAVGFLAETRLIPLGLPAWPYRVPLGVAVSLAGFASGWVLEKIKKPRLEKE
jgi:SSS family solute:Na+ symporter